MGYAEEGEGLDSFVKVILGGEITLEEVPSFSFGRISYDNTAQGIDLPEAQQMVVSDSTGLGEPWRVTVSFVDDVFFSNNFKLKLTPENDSDLVVASPTVLEDKEGVSVLQASSAEEYTKERNEYIFNYANGESNQLLLPDKAKNTSYATVLRWNLESTP